MKRLCCLLALMLLLGCLAGCAAPAAENASSPAAASTPADAPVPGAEYLPDFTVQTVDGETFALAEALRDHELVLVNLFATWCGPCGMGFPFLQEAWSQCSDRVAVLALTVEPEDTDAALRQYAAELGLTFPIGHEEGTGMGRFMNGSIPTTVLADRTGRVLAVEMGAKRSAQEFLDLFDELTGEGRDPALCKYKVIAYDELTGQPAAGVVANFCTDESCTPVVTEADGTAVFTGPPDRYHVQIVKTPTGMAVDGETEFTAEPYGQTFWIPLSGAAR